MGTESMRVASGTSPQMVPPMVAHSDAGNACDHPAPRPQVMSMLWTIRKWWRFFDGEPFTDESERGVRWIVTGAKRWRIGPRP